MDSISRLTGSTPAIFTPPSLFQLIESGASRAEIKEAYLGRDRSADKNMEMAPLYYAAQLGKIEAAAALIEAGADINAFDPKAGGTALHIAVHKGNKDLVSLLLTQGASVELPTKKDITPLCLATKLEIVKLLLQHGANINGESTGANFGNYTRLHLASMMGDEELIKLLLENGANIESPVNPLWSPLALAVSEGKAATVELLIARGARLGERKNEPHSTTLLHLAITKNHIEVVDVLLKSGTDMETPNLKGETPLFLATSLKCEEIVALLLTSGAAVDAPSTELKFTALHQAAWIGSKAIIKLLANHKANINLGNATGITPLLEAVFAGNVPSVKLLLKLGAEVKAAEQNKLILLQLALQKYKSCIGGTKENFGKIILLLLQHGAMENLNDASTERTLGLASDELMLWLLRAFIMPLETISIDHRKVCSSILQNQKPSEKVSVLKLLSTIPGYFKIFEGSNRYTEFAEAIPELSAALKHPALLQFLSEEVEVAKKSESYEKIKKCKRQITSLLSLYGCVYQPVLAALHQKKILAIQAELVKLEETYREKEATNKRTLSSLEQEFDEKDSLELLGTVGFGKGTSEYNAQDSYAILLNDPTFLAEAFYKCGIYEGRDLRALNIDFKLESLCLLLDEVTESNKQIDLLKEILSEISGKLAFLKELQSSSAAFNLADIIQDLSRLELNIQEMGPTLGKIDFDKSLLSEVRSCQRKYTLRLVQTFFAQGQKVIKEALQKASVNSLQELLFTPMQFYSLYSTDGKRQKINNNKG